MARDKNRNRLRKEVVITGATGFIGRRLVYRIKKKHQNLQILCLIKNVLNPLEESGRLILRELGVRTQKVDLATKEGLKQNQRAPDVIIHLAANTDTASTDHRVNDLGVENLYRSYSALARTTHFIHISTTAFMAGRQACSKPFNESTTPKPTNLYGRTKLRGEEYIANKCRSDGFCLTIIRLPTVYGRSPRSDSMFDFIKKMAYRNTMTSRLNWPGLTSLVYVDDVADAILALISKPPPPGIPNNYMLTAESLPFWQVVKMVYTTLGLDYKPIIVPDTVWGLFNAFRPLVYALEKIIPANIYNLFWRATLITDSVIYTESKKIYSILPNWKPKKLTNVIKQML